MYFETWNEILILNTVDSNAFRMHVKRKERLFRRAVRLENRLKPLTNVLNTEAEIPPFSPTCAYRV